MLAQFTNPRVSATICICDQCGHKWFPESGALPERCPSRKCRSVNWNAGATDLRPQSPPPTFVPEPKPDAATDQLEAYKQRPRAYTAPTILPGLAPADADNRARLTKLNEAKYSKRKK